MTLNTKVMSILFEKGVKVPVDRDDVIKVTKVNYCRIKLKIGTGMFLVSLNTQEMSILFEKGDKMSVDSGDVIRVTKMEVDGLS